MGKWFPGIRDRLNSRHQAAPARDPRPAGAQKGVTKRVHQSGPFVSPASRARTPWLRSGSGRDWFMRKDEPPRWSRTAPTPRARGTDPARTRGSTR